MKLKALLLLVIFSLSCSLAFSQSNTIHKVKKHETIFGIAREYGISIDELIDANPDMRNPGYDLKKGDMIVIPAKKTAKKATTAEAATPAVPVKSSVDVGIMLPLHDVDGDGRR
ncbi:MAG: LysM peptidoglycan-binding domain-containing protein, partial [Prevotella sp.]|nr:LysM peptidoglycan-binding domain-containing protein [Prevotella sp.]